MLGGYPVWMFRTVGSGSSYQQLEIELIFEFGSIIGIEIFLWRIRPRLESMSLKKIEKLN